MNLVSATAKLPNSLMLREKPSQKLSIGSLNDCHQFDQFQNLQILPIRDTSAASSLFIVQKFQTAPRDQIIGWDADARQRNLPLVVNKARFLILPWIRIPNLASHILAECEKRLADDWTQYYAVTPVLLETFCEKPRFKETCYRAANWTLVGQTKGRGKRVDSNSVRCRSRTSGSDRCRRIGENPQQLKLQSQKTHMLTPSFDNN